MIGTKKNIHQTGSWTYAVSTNCTNVSAATEAVKWLSGC